jgi:nucleoside-diphosphate-sugar epimerase
MKVSENTLVREKVELGSCLVIGGSGMVGFSIAEQLVAMGNPVVIYDIETPDSINAEFINGNICDKESLSRACQDADTVFQCAAVVWNPLTSQDLYEAVNIYGNENVIEASLQNNVSRLIYTSTMDVVVEGTMPIVYGDETLSYPEKMPEDHYSRTKIIAEQKMLQADCDELSICAIRPAGIYGPRDKYHLPNIAQMAQNSFSIKLGSGKACFSHVYCENVAYLHILAAQNLYHKSVAAGQIYFAVDHQPAENLFTFMEPFLIKMGLKPPALSIPYPIAYGLAWLSEKINPKSVFNRFSVIQTCIDHTFVSDKAERELGYIPPVSMEESVDRTVAWFKENFTMKQK